MDYSKDIEKQKTVMGYPSMARHNDISYQQSIPSTYVNNLHPPSYIMPTQGYPNYPSNPNSYPYPDATYYVNYSQKYIPLQEQNKIKNGSFGRYMSTMLLVLVVAMIIFSLVIWLLFGTEVPDFHVVSVQVPSFMITGTSLLGNWEVNVTMKNSNKDLDIKVNNGRTSIFYNTNLLAETQVDPFNLAAESSVIIFSNLTSSPGHFLDKGVLSDATTDRNHGLVNFALQISLGIQYTSKSESKSQRIRVYCNHVKVQFGHGPQDKGELVKGDNIDCLINS